MFVLSFLYFSLLLLSHSTWTDSLINAEIKKKKDKMVPNTKPANGTQIVAVDVAAVAFWTLLISYLLVCLSSLPIWTITMDGWCRESHGCVLWLSRMKLTETLKSKMKLHFDVSACERTNRSTWLGQSIELTLVGDKVANTWQNSQNKNSAKCQ